MKRNSLIITAVIVAIIIIAVGYVACTQFGSNIDSSPASTPTPTPTSSPTAAPQSTTPAQVRDAVMNYTEIHHPETAQYMQSLSWSGGKVTREGIVGAETYLYLSGNWDVTVNYPVTLNPTYTVNAIYTQTPSNQEVISWHGTWQNGVITETSYTYTPPA
jgi:hypothetical protein